MNGRGCDDPGAAEGPPFRQADRHPGPSPLPHPGTGATPLSANLPRQTDGAGGAAGIASPASPGHSRPGAAAPVLAVHDLAVARGGARTLEGVSFALHPGEALILRGPNGLGKTTLLRTVTGLQPPAAGRVETAPEAIAYAAHADGLKPTLTAAENLSFWQSVFGGPAVGPALTAMDLDHLAHRPARALSAGQKRRLGLARLLVSGRPVWALDEPTVSLDAASVALFAAVVRQHLAGGGAALIATHIDLGLPEARVLDLTPFRADPTAAPQGRPASFDEAFA